MKPTVLLILLLLLQNRLHNVTGRNGLHMGNVPRPVVKDGRIDTDRVIAQVMDMAGKLVGDQLQKKNIVMKPTVLLLLLLLLLLQNRLHNVTGRNGLHMGNVPRPVVKDGRIDTDRVIAQVMDMAGKLVRVQLQKKNIVMKPTVLLLLLLLLLLQE